MLLPRSGGRGGSFLPGAVGAVVISRARWWTSSSVDPTGTRVDPAGTSVELTHLRAQLRVRAGDGDRRGDPLHRQRGHRSRLDAPVPQPGRQLLAAAGVHDPEIGRAHV